MTAPRLYNRFAATADFHGWRHWEFGWLFGSGQLSNIMAYGVYAVLWLGPVTLRLTWLIRTYEQWLAKCQRSKPPAVSVTRPIARRA